MTAGARRFAVAAIGIAAAACVLRGSIADSIVSRGDEMLRAGNARAAATYYERATRIDYSNATAGDRLAFVSVMLHDSALRTRAKGVLKKLLRGRVDSTLQFDLALIDLKEHRYGLAQQEFARVSPSSGAPHAREFARALARKQRSGDR